MKLRNRSELQLEARGIKNDITLVSRSLVKEMVEIEPQNRGIETRWSRNSGNCAPTRERVQNAPQILENRTTTIPPCTLCKTIHSGQCRYGISCFTCGLPGHYARDCPSQESRVAMLAPVAKGRPNAQIYSINEGDVGAGPSTSASDLARSREISKIDFLSSNRQ